MLWKCFQFNTAVIFQSTNILYYFKVSPCFDQQKAFDIGAEHYFPQTFWIHYLVKKRTECVRCMSQWLLIWCSRVQGFQQSMNLHMFCLFGFKVPVVQITLGTIKLLLCLYSKKQQDFWLFRCKKSFFSMYTFGKLASLKAPNCKNPPKSLCRASSMVTL